MSAVKVFNLGARAASGRDLIEAQRLHRLLMQKPEQYALTGPTWRSAQGDDGLQNEGLNESKLSLYLPRSQDLASPLPVAASEVAELQIDDCADVAMLSQLPRFIHLRTLRLGGAGFIASLEWLPPLPALQVLRIDGFGRGLTSLKGVESLTSLVALALDPRDGRATVESYNPLSALSELRLLVLPALTAADQSLRPLGSLQKLEWFLGTAYFGITEYEELAARIPALRCPWFSDLAWELL